MKFQFSVLLFSIHVLFATAASSQANSTLESRMSDFIFRYQSQYFGIELLDFNDEAAIKTNGVKSIQTYYTDCVDLTKKRLKESFRYDSLGRLIEQRREVHSVADRVTYRYNAKGQLEEKKIFSYTEHLEKQLHFTYDVQGKLIKIATIEMLDELMHDQGGHGFPEMPFYSADTILYDFKNLTITVHHLMADRYQYLTTENAPIGIAFTNTFKFDASGRILSRELKDKNRKIQFTDQYTACWSFVNNKQYRNSFLDTCQLAKRLNPSPLTVEAGYTSLDTVFHTFNGQQFVSYIYMYPAVSAWILDSNQSYKITEKVVLNFDSKGTLVSREYYNLQNNTIIKSDQFFYDQLQRVIEENSFTAASWQRDFGIELVMSSMPPPPMDMYQSTFYEYYENGIIKCVKKVYQKESYASCEETFVEYF